MAARPRLVLAATILGSGMTFIDATGVNVALPVLQRDLHTGLAGAQWVVESYQLMLASLLLVGGALGDRFGRRRLFMIGVALFTLTSMWCGLAPSIGSLVIARAVQGMAAALLVPESLAIVSAAFDDAQRPRAIGLWSSLTALTVLLGPPLGGWLVDHASWRWLFFVNLPIGILTLALAAIGVEESRDPGQARLDVAGAVLVTLSLAAIVYPLVEWSRGDHGQLAAILAAGVVLLAVFVWFERRSRAPMLPPELFRSRPFTAANLLTLFLYAGLSAAMFLIPFTSSTCRAGRRPRRGREPADGGAADGAVTARRQVVGAPRLARAARRRPGDRRLRLRALRPARPRRQLLDVVLPCRDGARAGDGDHRGTAHHRGDGLRRTRSRRHRLRRQQRGVAAAAAGDCIGVLSPRCFRHQLSGRASPLSLVRRRAGRELGLSPRRRSCCGAPRRRAAVDGAFLAPSGRAARLARCRRRRVRGASTGGAQTGGGRGARAPHESSGDRETDRNVRYCTRARRDRVMAPERESPRRAILSRTSRPANAASPDDRGVAHLPNPLHRGAVAPFGWVIIGAPAGIGLDHRLARSPRRAAPRLSGSEAGRARGAAVSEVAVAPHHLTPRLAGRRRPRGESNFVPAKRQRSAERQATGRRRGAGRTAARAGAARLPRRDRPRSPWRGGMPQRPAAPKARVVLATSAGPPNSPAGLRVSTRRQPGSG